MIPIESSNRFCRLKHSSSEESNETLPAYSESAPENFPDDNDDCDNSYEDISDCDDDTPFSAVHGFQDFYRTLCKKRIVTNALGERISKMKSNNQRVKLVHKRLFTTLAKLNIKSYEKSDAKSIRFRELGLQLFLTNNYEGALQQMTRSIAWARTSEELGQALSSRSNILYVINKPKECLEDITRALFTDLSTRSRPNLISRAKELETRIFLEDKHYPPVVEIPSTEKHNSIQSASKSIDISNLDGYDRCIVATEKLEAGHVIAVEKPYISWIMKSDLFHCHYCMKLCYNPIPCEKCARSLYCNKICRSKANAAYHLIECEALKRGKHVGLIPSDLWGLKLILQTDNLASSRKLESRPGYRSDRLKEILDLRDNISKHAPPYILLPVIVRCAIIYHIIKFYTSYFKKKANSRRLKKIFRNKLVTHFGICFGNKFQIFELIRGLTYVPDVIGHGLYALGSLFNHSCTPNVVASHNGTTLVLTTVKNIEKGEQCFVSYSIHFDQEPLNVRQKILMTRYHFTCSCRACVEDWPMIEKLQYKTNVNKAQSEKYLEAVCSIDKIYDAESADACLKLLKKQVAIAQIFEPCLEMVYLRLGIESCCLWKGNLRHPIIKLRK